MTRGPDATDATYWRAFAEASPDVVLVLDLTGTILFINRVAPVYARQTIIGRKFWDFGAGGDAEARLRARLREVVESRKAVVYESPGLRGDGSPGWYEVRAIPVVVEGEVEHVLWVSADVSERKSLEAQARQAQKMEAVGLLAGGVAHDFNNLLAVIMGFGELATRAMPPDDPAVAHLQELVDAAWRGGELTRKLLAFSRKQVIQTCSLDVSAAVADFARVMERILGADVELVVEARTPMFPVSADPVQLEQVLLNLWTNARQAMPRGGKLYLSTEAVVLDEAFVADHPWARVGSFAKLTVKDTGVGMDSATLARVFEPFFTTKDAGTGLGLSTVYGIVEQHRGFVHAESAPGRGTTISVFFPQLADGEPSVTARRPTFAPNALRGEELILLAEDEPSLRSVVAATLADLGYRVIAAKNGEEAMRTFELHAQEVAVAVLDVVMPGMGGREVYDRMRAVRPEMKVLFMTGYAPSSMRLGELVASDRVEVIEKPFTPLALVAGVRRAIDAPRGPSPSA
jgi:two-component system NtrC family sensor kinase